HWADARQRGLSLCVEELCRDCPELLDDLRAQIHLCHQLEGLAGDEGRPAPGGSPPAGPGFQIEGGVGRGGMGVVSRARQAHLNRTVALKMILSGGHSGSEERLRFLAEAEAIASIEHPGVVQVHGFGTHEGLPWFALEYCSGGSLAGKLNGTP